MNYYKASKRKSDDRWDYTVTNDGYTMPVGYCCEYKPLTERAKHIIGEEQAEKEDKKYKPHVHKHHTNGHTTEDEAKDCYKQYQLDIETSYDHKLQDSTVACNVCKKHTECFVQIGGWPKFYLCDEHRNRETLEKIYQVNESMSS